MFYETMEDVLPELTVIIESGNGQTQTIVPLNPLFGTVTSNINAQNGEG